MRAGALRTIVTFQTLTETPDGYGGNTPTWGGDVTVPCQFMATSGRESVQGGRIEAPISATLTARAKAVTGIDASWRAVIDGVPWNIRQVIPFGQRARRTDFVIERGNSGVAV